MPIVLAAAHACPREGDWQATRSRLLKDQARPVEHTLEERANTMGLLYHRVPPGEFWSGGWRSVTEVNHSLVQRTINSLLDYGPFSFVSLHTPVAPYCPRGT